MSVFVFGWPKPYFMSLLSNAPIGLTAMTLGTASTAYLDKINFNERIEDYIDANLSFLALAGQKENDEIGEFYSSIVVMMITGIWSSMLSMMVNKPMSTKEKKTKEL